ncbi:unannotated protein [freshwater metagenome]|uniref:Unannotated protein n=1 Tax=freshwater metagenome TaxID=449393 RepID=A0A6J7DIZ7_9ZZZZ
MGAVNTAAAMRAMAAGHNEWPTKNRRAQASAAATLSARPTSHTVRAAADPLSATAIPAAMSAAKLYGQMMPNTALGGCQGGCSSERYQTSPVVTHRPEATA